MIEHLKISFVQFGRDIKISSLDELLNVFHSENLLPYFSGIGNNIASDMQYAVSMLYVTFIKMI